MVAMLHARNNTILFLWDKMFILMQNIFIVPAMQHGRHAKPLLSTTTSTKKEKYIYNLSSTCCGLGILYPC